jgi:hypothetical protein
MTMTQIIIVGVSFLVMIGILMYGAGAIIATIVTNLLKDLFNAGIESEK